MTNWQLVAVSRKYAPGWLWSWMSYRWRARLLTRGPLSWLLFRDIEVDADEVKQP